MQKAQSRKLMRIIATVVFAVLAVVVPLVTVFFAGIFIPPQYARTYYGELHDMYVRLKTTEGKKVVVVGSSSVAFGVDSALAEELLNDCGLNYSVCNFGLYGSLGTKMMLDLSRNYIGEGDIVVFAPEISSQLLSLYFSSKEAWYALDNGMEMFWDFEGDVQSMLAGSFAGYTAEKFAQWQSGEPAAPSGVYAHASFDGRCDLKNYERPYNVMPGGHDANNPVSLDTSLYSRDFIDYVNSYCAEISSRGAAMYYSFPPMNRDSVADMSEQKLEEFTTFVAENFNFPLISDISDYIMDSEWFYDSNFHLNTSGMTVRTVQLVNDIKNELGNTSKTDAVLPEKPIIPDPGIEGEGDNSDKDCFTYEQDGNYYIITGLTEKGLEQTELVVPYQVNGLYVREFGASVFAGNTTVREITIQENIDFIEDGSFSGCDNLKKIILTHDEPSDISVGYGLLSDTRASVYVSKDVLSQFKNDYFWGSYAEDLIGY